MSSENERSGWETLWTILEGVWAPAIEAGRVQTELNVHSLEETCGALVRAGYEVSYVDLPDKVSGLAVRIECRPHIVVNRAKSRAHQRYTVSHELGHHVLHLNPSRKPIPSPFATEGLTEFQAHMFAASWVLGVARDKELENVLKQNPELPAQLTLSMLVTGGILAVGLLGYVLSRFLVSFSIEQE